MKKAKLFLILALALMVCASVFLFVACGNDEEGGGGTQVFTFEAEYVDCSGIEDAPGWSGGGGGTDIIGHSESASNKFFVTYLYGEGITLEFKINSDKAVNDARIIAVLSAEGGKDFTISTDNYKIEVNGSALQFSPIQFRNVPALPGMLPFTECTLASNVSLTQGENVIKMITANSLSLGGTTEATAPVVDCLKIRTSASLTWNPVTSNLDDF